MGAAGHMWLLSTCYVASAVKELSFQFNLCLNNHMELVVPRMNSTGLCAVHIMAKTVDACAELL